MKKFKYTIIIILALAILAVVFKITYIKDGTIDEGTYQVTDFEQFPNASITVTESTIQFHNIDLNKIYQEKQLEQYKKTHDVNPELSYSEKEIETYSDLNQNFVNNAFNIPYEQSETFKSGTFEYTYYFYPGNSIFGLVIIYDSFHKTLKINNEIQEINFEK